MNIAVIGTGKTGGELLDLIPENQIIGPFNTRNEPTAEKLQQADVAVIFVPGSAVDDIFDAVIKSGIPAVWGSTGYEWPIDLDQELKDQQVKWLRASNFSLGMNIVRRCISIISKGSELLTDPKFHIHEIHHTDKKDAPSGTALSWKEWLGKEAEITSERKGDIKGIHQLEMDTESESIILKHQAHNRALFAKGALWSAEQLLKENVGYGFHDIETIFDNLMQDKL
jgi:4-hydroxy-tetrahydrodipicolinate reductase